MNRLNNFARRSLLALSTAAAANCFAIGGAHAQDTVQAKEVAHSKSISAAETKTGAKSKNADTSHLEKPRIEVCFVLDTTGSMSGLIQGAKDKIWLIANELLESETTPEIQFSLIGYRDRGDQYVTKITKMTDDIDEVYTDLTAFVADGGNDKPESVNQALNEALTQIEWSVDDSVLKIVFLVGDAPPHMDYDDDVLYSSVCKVAKQKGVIINTIQCGADPETTAIWEEIAQIADGEFSAIEQSGGTQQIQTPYDAELARYNISLNRTVCGYGDSWVQKSVKQKILSNQGSKAESIADRASFFSTLRNAPASPSCNQAVGGQQDLVEMLMDGKIELTDVKNDLLPEDLKNLEIEERNAKLTERIAERKKVLERIDELVAQRTAFLKENRSKVAAKPDSFDVRVRSVVQAQAAAKGIKYSVSDDSDTSIEPTKPPVSTPATDK